jgi:hypothetical protein
MNDAAITYSTLEELEPVRDELISRRANRQSPAVALTPAAPKRAIAQRRTHIETHVESM